VRSEVVVVESNRAANGSRALALAKSWGYHPVFACSDPTEYDGFENNPIRIADEVIVVDTLDPRWLPHRLLGRNVAAVVAYDEPSLMTAASCAAIMSQNPAPSLRGVANTRFKHLMRNALHGTPLGIPWALVPTDAGETRDSPVGYPCVVKPADVGGNYAVSVCSDRHSYDDAVAQVARLSREGYGRYTPLSGALVEAYLDGPEYSVEMAWSTVRNSWQVLGITEKRTIAASNPLEHRHIFPAPLLGDVAKAIEDVTRSCLDLLGLRHTLVHAEMKVTPSGVLPVEVNCRPAGGHISDLVAACYGQDLVETHLRVALGDPASLEAFSNGPHGAAGIQYVIPPDTGLVNDVRVAGDLPAGVSAVFGSFPIAVEQMHSDARLGYLTASALDAGTVEELLLEASNMVEIAYARSF